MKRFSLLLLFSLIFADITYSQTDPVIMTIGDKKITKSEFEYIWNKNNTNNSIDRKSLNEYVDLFVNFKLKVAEAESKGLDTTAAFKNEFQGYRNQLTGQYLTDEAARTALVNQTYNRIKEYVEASHILVLVKQNPSPEDTLIAWNKIINIYNQAIKGTDFAKLARENSDDGSKSEGGYLGFATGFRYVYPFENAVYNTEPGNISKPFKTQYGYHIVKVHSKRMAGGRYRSGHIMKMVAADAGNEAKETAKKAIFDIYKSLQEGGDFKKFATEQSDDQSAAANQGEYGLMYCGSLPIEYEDAVYGLKIGEYSKPFQTKFGWHIVKALEFQPFPSVEEMAQDINGIIGRDERSLVPKKSFVENLKKEYSYNPNSESLTVVNNAYRGLSENNDSTLLKSIQNSSVRLFTIDGIEYTQRDFVNFIKTKGLGINDTKSAYNEFVSESLISYEDSKLEKKYPDFGHLMQEYRDGILLFEVSNREVWDKASQDTEGLENYFKQNKKSYNWDKPRFKGFVISCADQATAKSARKLIKKLNADSVSIVLKRTFNNDSTILIKVERGLYSEGENANVDSLVFKKKTNNQDKTLPVRFVNGKLLKNKPEDYTDVKGLVISDYQNYLEKRWLEALRAKYKVDINQEVVNTVNKD